MLEQVNNQVYSASKFRTDYFHFSKFHRASCVHFVLTSVSSILVTVSVLCHNTVLLRHIKKCVKSIDRCAVIIQLTMIGITS